MREKGVFEFVWKCTDVCKHRLEVQLCRIRYVAAPLKHPWWKRRGSSIK